MEKNCYYCAHRDVCPNSFLVAPCDEFAHRDDLHFGDEIEAAKRKLVAKFSHQRAVSPMVDAILTAIEKEPLFDFVETERKVAYFGNY